MFGINTKRAADHRFRAASTVALETVVERLGAARRTLADAEQEVRDKSLEAVLSDDAEAATGPVRERLRRARDQVELCEAALEVAQRAEKVRKQGVADQAERSRIAAIRQHAATATKHAVALRDAITDMMARFTDMATAIGKAERLLTAHEITHCFGTGPTELWLRDAVASEFVRIAARNPTLRLPVDIKFSHRAVQVHGRWDGDRQTIDEVIRAKLDLGALRQATPVEATPVEASPVEASPVEEDRTDDSPAEAMARYHAAVAAEQPGEQEFHERDAPEPEPELSAEEHAALDALLAAAEPIPAAEPTPVSAGARGLREITAGMRKGK